MWPFRRTLPTEHSACQIAIDTQRVTIDHLKGEIARLQHENTRLHAMVLGDYERVFRERERESDLNGRQRIALLEAELRELHEKEANPSIEDVVHRDPEETPALPLEGLRPLGPVGQGRRAG